MVAARKIYALSRLHMHYQQVSSARSRIVVFVLVLFFVLTLVACAEKEEKGTLRAPAPANFPTIEFVEPRNGAAVGSRFAVTVRFKNFVLDDKNFGGRPVVGRGHLHFSLDNGLYDYPRYRGDKGDLSVLAEQIGGVGKYTPATSTEISYRNIPPGDHTLNVEFAANDHTSDEIGATEQVEVVAKKTR